MKLKILFVDEDVEIEVTKNVLASRRPEHEFSIAWSLRIARDLLWSTKFDVVVLDIMLPSDDSVVPGSSSDGSLTSGVKLFELIRASSCPNRDTPVVVLTGVSDEHPEILQLKKTLGPNFLSKPLHPDSLWHSIMRAADVGDGDR